MKVIIKSIVVVAAAALCLPGLSHDAGVRRSLPGLLQGGDVPSHPGSQPAGLPVILHPTRVRTPNGTTVSTTSQQTIFSALNRLNGGRTVLADGVRSPSPLTGGTPWMMFQQGRDQFGLGASHTDPRIAHHLGMEILLSPGRDSGLVVYAIHGYVLEPDGGQDSSFLLSPGHELLRDPDLRTHDASVAGRAALVKQATAVGLPVLLHAVAPPECGQGRRPTTPEPWRSPPPLGSLRIPARA